MTDPIPFSGAGNRDALRARIEAAERRNADRTLADQAREAADAAVDYTRANPLTVIGGALAVGLLIGLLTRPGRRMASRAIHTTTDAISGTAASARSGVSNLTSRGATGHSGSGLGRMVGEAALGYAMTIIDEVLETARAGQERAGELGDAAGTQAKKLSANASEAASTAAGSTRAFARKTREAAAGVVRDLGRKTKG